MRVLHLGQDTVADGRFVAAIGNFDGVHWGHRALLSRVRAAAAAQQRQSLAITFWPHPRAVLQPERWSGYLMTLDERLATLEAVGLDACLIIPFTTAFAQSTPEQFVSSLHAQSTIDELWVGEDFRFGHKRAGDVTLLRELGRNAGMAVRTLARQSLRNTVVGSGGIRDLIQDGEVATAGSLLAGAYRLSGTVVSGDRRGRTLGFPTANLATDEGKLIPARGIYAARISGGGLHHAAAVSIGIRPQFDGVRELVEAFVLDFSGDLYGQRLTLEFVARLRSEERFASVEALITQMKRDVERTRKLVG